MMRVLTSRAGLVWRGIWQLYSTCVHCQQGPPGCGAEQYGGVARGEGGRAFCEGGNQFTSDSAEGGGVILQPEWR